MICIIPVYYPILVCMYNINWTAITESVEMYTHIQGEQCDDRNCRYAEECAKSTWWFQLQKGQCSNISDFKRC